MDKEPVGKITHVFGRLNVGVVELEGELKVGDTISVEGGGRQFEQKIDSMQIDRKPVESANPGDDIGVKFSEPVKEGDKVYRITEE